MPSMIPCPKCGESHFHKSHTRNLYEKTRKKLFRQQPYRCHKCGHRSWIASSMLKPKSSPKQIIIYISVFILAIIMSMLLKNFLS